jgi:hypothetical protein
MKEDMIVQKAELYINNLLLLTDLQQYSISIQSVDLAKLCNLPVFQKNLVFDSICCQISDDVSDEGAGL